MPTISVKKVQRNARRRSAVPNYKIFFPLKMAKAHAAAISNRFQQPSFSASLRPMSTPMTEAIISPRVQPEESPRQCSP